MATQELTNVVYNEDGGGIFAFSKTFTSADTTEYILPIDRIYALTAYLNDDSGVGVVSFTNDSPLVIRAGNAVYVEWDGVSNINIGVTGFKFTWTSGSVIFKLTVKTEKP